MQGKHLNNDAPAVSVYDAGVKPLPSPPVRSKAPVLGWSGNEPRRTSLEPWDLNEPLRTVTSHSPREGPATCDQCRETDPYVAYCPACSFHFCRKDWDAQILHQGQRLVNGVPHEKTSPDLAKRIKSIIEPSISEHQQNQLHRADDDTTWFGVLPDAVNQLLFHDFGRYEEFLSQSMFNPKSSQFPSLISFVGPTGAGKSTIVKGLIKLSGSGLEPLREQTPVVGLVQHQAVPTSGEVHLYWDPSSLYTNRPLLYADCEGLGGGSREPMAARATATRERKTLTKERREKDRVKSPYETTIPSLSSSSTYSQTSRYSSGRPSGHRQPVPSFSSMSPSNTPMPPSPGPQRQSFGDHSQSSTPSYSPYSPVIEQTEPQGGWTPGSGKIYRGVTRKINWAHERDKRSRQYIVENLYPRLLYTFSDIVILVMRNPKLVSIVTYSISSTD